MMSLKKSSERIQTKTLFLTVLTLFTLTAFAQTASCAAIAGNGYVGTMQIQNDRTRVYVNGIRTNRPDTIRPETIASVFVLNRETALGRYPDLGDNEKGVIEIMLLKPGQTRAKNTTEAKGPVTVVGVGSESKAK